MSNRPQNADYAAIALGPVLIFLMISSLANFFVMLFYDGSYPDRVFYLILMYTMGSVSLARLVIEEDRAYSAGYAIALGAAMLFVMTGFLGSTLFTLGLVLLIGYLADRIVHDCTVIDESVDASGEGLIDRTLDEAGDLADQAQGKVDEEAPESEKERRRRKSHQPGRTVFLLALAALPLFGLGQFMLSGNPAVWARAQLMLGLYLFSSLSLLVATSFLNLRRYLRQREVEMPGDVTVAWLVGGISMIAALLLLAFLAPMPGASLAQIQLPKFLRDEGKSASSYGWGNEGAQEAEPENAAQTGRDPASEKKQQVGAGDNQNRPSGQSGGNKPGPQGEGGGKGPQKSGGQSSGKQGSGQQGSGNQSSGSKASGKQSSGGGDSSGGRSKSSDPGGSKGESQKGGRNSAGDAGKGARPTKSANDGSQSRPPTSSGDPKGSQSGAQSEGQKTSGGDSSSDGRSSNSRSDAGNKGSGESGKQESAGRKDGNGERDGQRESGASSSAAGDAEQPSEQGDPSREKSDDGSKSGDEESPSDSESETTNSEGRREDESRQEKRDGNKASSDESQQQGDSERTSSSDGQGNAGSAGSMMPSLTGMLGGLASLFRLLLILALVGVVAYYLYRIRDQLARLWRSLFERERNVSEAEETFGVDERPGQPPRPFSSFTNPMGREGDPRRAIVTTYQAYDAWMRERGLPRRADETAAEFLVRLRATSKGQLEVKQVVGPVEQPLRQLAQAYDRVVYGRGRVRQSDLDVAATIWRHMEKPRAPVARPEESPVAAG